VRATAAGFVDSGTAEPLEQHVDVHQHQCSGDVFGLADRDGVIEDFVQAVARRLRAERQAERTGSSCRRPI